MTVTELRGALQKLEAEGQGALDVYYIQPSGCMYDLVDPSEPHLCSEGSIRYVRI